MDCESPQKLFDVFNFTKIVIIMAPSRQGDLTSLLYFKYVICQPISVWTSGLRQSPKIALAGKEFQPGHVDEKTNCHTRGCCSSTSIYFTIRPASSFCFKADFDVVLAWVTTTLCDEKRQFIQIIARNWRMPSGIYSRICIGDFYHGIYILYWCTGSHPSSCAKQKTSIFCAYFQTGLGRFLYSFEGTIQHHL